jgi:hypothetical protein
MLTNEQIKEILQDFIKNSKENESISLPDMVGIGDFCDVVNELYYPVIDNTMEDYIEPYIQVSYIDLDFGLPFKANDTNFQLIGTFRYGYMHLTNYGKI